MFLHDFTDPNERPHIPLIHLAQQRHFQLEHQRRLLQQKLERQHLEHDEYGSEDDCSTCMGEGTRRLTTITEHTEPSVLSESISSLGSVICRWSSDYISSRDERFWQFLQQGTQMISSHSQRCPPSSIISMINPQHHYPLILGCYRGPLLVRPALRSCRQNQILTLQIPVLCRAGVP